MKQNATANRLDLLYALQTGRASDIEDMRGAIPWGQLSRAGGLPHSLYNASAGYANNAAMRLMEDAALALLSMAAQEGRAEVFELFNEPHGDVVFPQPVLNFITIGYDRVLALYVENGFNPHAKLGSLGMMGKGETVSAIEVARHFGNDATADAMASAASRKRVNDVLGDAGTAAKASGSAGKRGASL